MKKALAILLVMILAIYVVPMAFAATVASGTVENITWKLDNDGTLTISGTGEMPYLGDQADYPWYRYHNYVETVKFGEGITDVASYVFETDYDYLESIIFSSTISKILVSSFSGCDGLKTVTLPGNIKELSLSAFSGCRNLETVILQEGIEQIGPQAFAGCPKLKNIVIPMSVKQVWQHAFAECDALQDISILNKACVLIDNEYSIDWSQSIPAQTTIHGYTGSTAEEYAKRFNRTFVALDASNAPANDYLGGLKTFFDSIIKMLKPMLDNLMNTLKQLFANTTTQPTDTTTQPADGTAESTSLFANLLPLLTKAFSGILTLLQSASGQATQPTA